MICLIWKQMKNVKEMACYVDVWHENNAVFISLVFFLQTMKELLL